MSNYDLRRSLANVATDLWGAPPARPAAAEPAEAAPAAEEAFPPFEALWKLADETVDWTEALVHAAPTDALTDPQRWALYHRYAQRVLSGDPESYLDVLCAVNPLADLAPWAVDFDVVPLCADALQLRFTALPAYLEGTEPERQRYLAGLALRAARDLFALLPVLKVSVEALHEARPLLRVTYDKAELLKVRFRFIDPAAFALACGGEFLP